MKPKSHDLDFELNLMPVLSVLSICICFLLTTAIWNRMGFVGIHQAIGDELPESGVPSDSLFLKAQKNGSIVLQWKRGKDSSVIAEKTIASAPVPNTSLHNAKGRPRGSSSKQGTSSGTGAAKDSYWQGVRSEIEAFVSRSQLKTIIVMPEVGTNYGHTIALLDQLKSLSLNIGLAPAVAPMEKGR